MPVTPLKKPIRRRIGSLVVELTDTHLRVRGKHKQKWLAYTWDRILSLANETEAEQLPILTQMELTAGRRLRERLTTARKQQTGGNK